MSGVRSLSQATAESTRCLIEFTFQVAIRMGGLCASLVGRDGGASATMHRSEGIGKSATNMVRKADIKSRHATGEGLRPNCEYVRGQQDKNDKKKRAGEAERR
jgi:hypothetical protein